MISVTKGSHNVPSTKSTHFGVSKDECNTKVDTGKSMKNALYMAKDTSQAEATSNRKVRSLNHCQVTFY